MKGRVTALVLATSTVLAGCSGPPGGGEVASRTAPVALEDQIPLPYQLAVCAGDYREALSLVPPRYRDDPLSLFMAAYALEGSGHAVRAHPLYERIADAGLQDTVRVVCGGTARVEGTLSTVSRDRALGIEVRLAALDANMRPVSDLHEGLPAQNAETDTVTRRQREDSDSSVLSTGRRLTVGGTRGTTAERQPAASASQRTRPPAMTRPDSLDPIGRWFVHLSSYFAEDNADSGRAALAALYPAFEGLFDSWQVDLNGRRTWRLGVRLSDEGEARAICNRLDSAGFYCRVIDSTPS